MTSTERVRNVILGKPVDRQSIYGWVAANLTQEITERWGSVANFEDKYEFDMCHIFGGPEVFNKSVIGKLRRENDELTPDIQDSKRKALGLLHHALCSKALYNGRS